MGIGIAIDVMLATVAKFRDSDLSLRNWTLPIAVTHIVFPALGYYGFWLLGQAFLWLSPILGVVGGALVSLFIYEIVASWIGHRPIFAISAWFGDLCGLKEGDARRIMAIMAVSWDALWSGPAKAAQATAGDWTGLEVGWSFAVAGVVVAIAAQLSLGLALWLREQSFEDVRRMADLMLLGMFAEVAVIGGFGVLSFLQGTGISGSIYHAVFAAAVIMGFVFLGFFGRIREFAIGEAEEAIGGVDRSVTGLLP